jgi:hypothetical protein
VSAKRDDNSYLVEAKQRLLDIFQNQSIFQQPRENALYHFCAVLEVEAFKAAASPKAHFNAHRAAALSSTRAIPGIFERCSPGGADELRINQDVFMQARELFEFSRDYEDIAFSFELADKGQFEIYVARCDPRITFSYASPEAEARDTLLRSGEVMERIIAPASKNEEAAMLDAADRVRKCLEGLIRPKGADAIEYEFTQELVSVVQKWAEGLMAAVPWEFPEALNVGPIRFGDLRRFWGALLAISNTHDMAHLIAMGGVPSKWPIGSIVAIRSSSQWITSIARVSALRPELVLQLLDWYKFDPAVSAATPILQPFLEILPDRICVPSSFLIGNAIERNFLKLLNRHPQMRQYVNTVNQAKEPLALDQIGQLFPEPSFQIAQQLVIPGLTDADIIVYERSSGFVLVLQHKWLISPDTAKESGSNDDELRKGVQQAVKSRDAFSADPQLLRKALRLTSSDRISEIGAAVVCRGSESTGFVPESQVPVVSERAFRLLVEKAKDLGQLWNALKERPDLAQAAQSVLDAKRKVNLAGYEFVFPVLAT